jgi:hypothetical protein
MSGCGYPTWCQIKQVANLPDQVAAVIPTAGPRPDPSALQGQPIGPASSLLRSVWSLRVRLCAWMSTARDEPLLLPTASRWVRPYHRTPRKSLPKNVRLRLPTASAQPNPSSSCSFEDGRTGDVRVKDYLGSPEESCRVFAGESTPVRARVPLPLLQIPREPPSCETSVP